MRSIPVKLTLPSPVEIYVGKESHSGSCIANRRKALYQENSYSSLLSMITVLVFFINHYVVPQFFLWLPSYI